MQELVTLDQAKAQLKLEATDTDRDDYIQDVLIPAAQRAVENASGLIIIGDATTADLRDLPVLTIAVLLQIEDWYVNGITGAEVCAPVKGVLGTLRTWVMR